jgi:hypothetical protein
MTIRLKAKLNVEKKQAPETPFLITFELFNAGDEDVYVLKRNTPLEGLRSDCFSILRDGMPVLYDGPLVKRGAPTKRDYQLIKAGNSASKTIDLSRCYQVSVPGKYEVSFKGHVGDVKTRKSLKKLKKDLGATFEERPVSARVEKFVVRKGGRGRATAGEIARADDVGEPDMAKRFSKKKKKTSLKPPKLVGGTPSKKTKVRAAHKNGYNLTVSALASLRNNAKYKKWFGVHTSSRFSKVKSAYTKTRDGMRSKTFTYYLDPGDDCEAGDLAYTFYGSTKIWLCSGFWSAPATGTDSKAGTVLHEHTHASADTDDHAYGQSDCLQLAKDDPAKAIDNADNYEYYAGG